MRKVSFSQLLVKKKSCKNPLVTLESHLKYWAKDRRCWEKKRSFMSTERKLWQRFQYICSDILSLLEKSLITMLHKRMKSSIWKWKETLLRVCGVASGAEGKGLWISHHKHTNKLWGQQKRSARGHILSDWISSLTFLCSIMRVELLWASLLSCIDNFWWDHCLTWYTGWEVIYSRQKWKDWEATWPCRHWIPNETKLKQEKEGKIN